MRLATAADEILPLQGPARAGQPGLPDRHPAVARHHAARVASRTSTRRSSRSLYRGRPGVPAGVLQPINRNGNAARPGACPQCAHEFELELAGAGGSRLPLRRAVRGGSLRRLSLPLAAGDVLELEHAERRRWVEEISAINQRMNEGTRRMTPKRFSAREPAAREAGRRRGRPLGAACARAARRRGCRAHRRPRRRRPDDAALRPARSSTAANWRSRRLCPRSSRGPLGVLRRHSPAVADCHGEARLSSADRSPRHRPRHPRRRIEADGWAQPRSALRDLRELNARPAAATVPPRTFAAAIARLAERGRRVEAGSGRSRTLAHARASRAATGAPSPRRRPATRVAPPPAAAAETAGGGDGCTARSTAPAAPARAARQRSPPCSAIRRLRRLDVERLADQVVHAASTGASSPTASAWGGLLMATGNATEAARSKVKITNRARSKSSPCTSTPRSTRSTRTTTSPSQAIPGLSSPLIQFVDGNMRTLEMELFFDTYDTPILSKQDVATQTGKIAEADGDRPGAARAADPAASPGRRCDSLRAGPGQPEVRDVRRRRQAGARAAHRVVQRVDRPRAGGEGSQRQTADFSKVHVVARARR